MAQENAPLQPEPALPHLEFASAGRDQHGNLELTEDRPIPSLEQMRNSAARRLLPHHADLRAIGEGKAPSIDGQVLDEVIRDACRFVWLTIAIALLPSDATHPAAPPSGDSHG